MNHGSLENRFRWRDTRGLSFIEVMVAVAILAITVAVTAQGFIQSYASIRLQEERTRALNDCRAVLSALRQAVLNAEPDAVCPSDEPQFPCVAIRWRDAFPATPEAYAALPEADRALLPGLFTLPNQTYQIDLLDEAGNPAQTSPAPAGNTNPVIVGVTTRWTGPGGITYAVQARTALTDR
ncbi:MAG TPA: type II secretion system protein [Candidatus Hydrogenedentes bacterium]|mgnify:FL=1|nr:type II secretion system protein [Candidatus Hydrogenedentota bacterium]HOK89710.1 type II secretion system protein [Candidatus Hydrogenedentota bacterium]HPO30031.1 type II secretion system protein [Candidatus Hydrogenedentota bacterium]